MREDTAPGRDGDPDDPAAPVERSTRVEEVAPVAAEHAHEAEAAAAGHAHLGPETRHLLEHPHGGDQAHPLHPDHEVARASDTDADASDPPGREVPEQRRRGDDVVEDEPGGRPLIERIGMAAIALLLASLFGGVALAAFSGGEPFLGVMGVVGCLMTLWVGGLTLFRG
jgi:hypothetical protein